jgi:hypothetical protein
VIALLSLVWHITIDTRTDSTTKLATLQETCAVLSRNLTERDWQSLLEVILYNTFNPKLQDPFQIVNHLVRLSNWSLPNWNLSSSSDAMNVENWDTMHSIVNTLLAQYANEEDQDTTRFPVLNISIPTASNENPDTNPEIAAVNPLLDPPTMEDGYKTTPTLK